MQKRVRNDEAVSPVIGVILMVAITVILAAVIAAFVFGMAGTTSKTKNVAATAQVNGLEIVYTYQGGADNGAVTNVTALQNGTAVDVDFPDPIVVGSQATYNKTTTSQRVHATAVAKFDDGSSQVILDTYV